jgi:hypothetical protein
VSAEQLGLLALGVLILLWWASGVAAAVFYWTRRYDMTINDAVVFLFLGIVGMLGWVLFYLPKEQGDRGRVLMKRRQ